MQNDQLDANLTAVRGATQPKFRVGETVEGHKR